MLRLFFELAENAGLLAIIPLIEGVESAAKAVSLPTPWLHTERAERIYAKAGGQPVETVERKGKLPVTLMRPDVMPSM